MKKLILALALLLLPLTAQAATVYYVRPGGGTSLQCTGTTDADYSGTGTGQACSFSHPSWALGATGTSAIMVGGDTLIISDTASATYKVGFGMPNTVGCSQGASYDCLMNAPPSGPDALHPTRILGSAYTSGCSTKPQLWGTEGAKQVIYLTGKSNVDIECLDITDHSTCGYIYGSPVCNANFNGSSVGTYGRWGIAGDAVVNLTLKNVDVHGMSRTALMLGDISGVTNLDHVNLDGNYYAGWDGDTRFQGFGGTGSLNNGILNMNYVNVRFNGCREAYPRSSSYTAADYTNCTDQSQNNDGLGSYDTGGTWNITNSNFSHNMSDGFDMLYCKNCVSINVDKTLFEGNEGNQFKITTKNLSLTNSILIANCGYHAAAGKVLVQNEPCRANGTPISATPGQGGTWYIANNTASTATGTGGSPFIEIINRYGVCNGTETYTYRNNILRSNHSATNWVPYYSGLTGSCQTAWTNATTQNSQVYDFQGSCLSGTGNVCTAPAWVGAISNSAATNVANVYLSSNVGGGGAATFWNTSKDYNGYTQNASIDRGAIQNGSSVQQQQAGQACIAATDCASGTCTNFVCSGSCTANAGACSTGATCCSGTCTASVCANPATCGDGSVQPPEVCDGSNLNGSNCILQGFTAGTLACASNCLSYNTASCTSAVVFPLTPVLDSFTRANSTGISNTSWTNTVGSFNISSNAAVPVNGASTTNKYYWNPTVFNADEEAYVTMSNKGSNGDCFKMQARFNVATSAGYALEVCPGASTMYVFKEPGEVQLGATISQAMSSGDSAGFSIIGSTITVYRKASAGSWASLTTRTDTTYASGGALTLGSYTGAGATPDIKFTNFGGGSLNPVTCGNNLKEGVEVCDGTDLNSRDCTTQGFTSGTLSCATDCNSFVTSSCVTATVCGDNTKAVGEVCDGTDLDSSTCVTQGYASGTLSCASDCLSYTTTGCVSSSNNISGGMIFK